VFHSAQPNQTIMGFLFNLPRAANVTKASAGVTATALNHTNNTILIRGNRIATSGKTGLQAWYARQGLVGYCFDSASK
jgi:hypothetical protein